MPSSQRSRGDKLAAFLATGEGYRAIRRAINAPEKITARLSSGDGEQLVDWQTRAVMAALGKVMRDD